MEDLQGDKESIEYEIRREKLDEAGCVVERGVKYPSRVEAAPDAVFQLLLFLVFPCLPGDDPNKREEDEHSVANFPEVCIAKQLSQLEQRVGAVVDQHDQGADPGKVGGPAEHYQQDGRVVVDEHLPEVFPANIEPLADGKGPVEGELQHVVAPDPPGHGVEGVVVPALPDVPQPRLVPQAAQPEHKDEGVEDEPINNIQMTLWSMK